MPRGRLYRKRGCGRPNQRAAVPDSEVVPVLVELAGRFPPYGYRRLKVLVSRQLGRPVNDKRIRRLMHEHGLVTAQRVERARPRPHPREVEATGPNQVWQMDFTKVLVGSTWYWLLVVLDRFTREIVGRSLTRYGRAKEVLAVLDVAMVDRFPCGVRWANLKIASDNGAAFLAETVHAFARHLEVELMRTRVRYPEGNGRCERVIRTIKKKRFGSTCMAPSSTPANGSPTSLPSTTPSGFIRRWDTWPPPVCRPLAGRRPLTKSRLSGLDLRAALHKTSRP